MNGYTQLTREQRYQIYAYRKAGWNQTQTAVQLQVHKSTISREINRNRGRRGYRAKQAQVFCESRRAGSYRPRIGILEWQRVEALIRREWSPVQVRDRLAEEGQQRKRGRYPFSRSFLGRPHGRNTKSLPVNVSSLRINRSEPHGRPLSESRLSISN